MIEFNDYVNVIKAGLKSDCMIGFSQSETYNTVRFYNERECILIEWCIKDDVLTISLNPYVPTFKTENPSLIAQWILLTEEVKAKYILQQERLFLTFFDRYQSTNIDDLDNGD